MLHRLMLATQVSCCDGVDPATRAAIDDSTIAFIAPTTLISTTAPANASPNSPAIDRANYALLGVFLLLSIAGIVFYQATATRLLKQSKQRKWADLALSDELIPRVANEGSTLDDADDGVDATDSPQQQAKPTTYQLTTSEPTSPPLPLATPAELTRLAKVSICEELLHDLHRGDPIQRRKAIWELGQRGDSRAVQPLLDLLMDADSQQRSLILAAIAEIGVRTLKPMNRALLVSLQDESPEVRKNAIRDATRLYDLIAHMSQLLHHATNDSNPEVRETAYWAMHQLDRIRVAPDAALPSDLSGRPNSALNSLSLELSTDQSNDYTSTDSPASIPE